MSLDGEDVADASVSLEQGTLTFEQVQAQMKAELQSADKDVFSRY